MNNSLSELREMRRSLPSNQRNADFQLKLGQIYYDRSVGSSLAFRLDRQVKVSNIVDWQSYQSAIKYSFASFNLNPTIDSALLILNSFELVSNHTAAVNFILQQNLMEKFPDERMTVASVLLHSLAKSGLLLQSVQSLYEFSPTHFQKAQQDVAKIEETLETNFKRSTRADCPSIFKKGQTDEGFSEFCQELLDDFQRERNIQDHLANNMNWNYEYCFNTGIEIHKQGFMRVAMQIYALAFFLNPLESEAELYSAVSLHLMGEHQVAFQRLNQFIDKYPNQPCAYVIAGHSCAIMNDITGLELILTKADVHNIKMPLLDFLIGFHLESKGQPNEALSLYEKRNQETNVEMFSSIYSFLMERIKHEH